MSFNTQYTLQQKRKHGDVAEKVIHNLQPYKKRELSPSSSRLRDNLFEMAHNSLESGDAADENILESVFDFFKVRQEQAREAEKQCKELSNRIVNLEEQLKFAKQQYADSQQEEQKVKAEMDEFELLLEYGDWFQLLIGTVRRNEPKLREAERDIFKDEFEAENKKNKEEAVNNAKAQAVANGVKYIGNHGFKPVKTDKEAKKHADWPCLEGRFVTETEERVEVEKGKIFEWRAGDGDEDTAPATPFLDRLQKLCDKAGVTRPQLLVWMNEYSKRNNICHTKPPQIQDYQKTVMEDSKEVKMKIQVQDKTGAFDWVSYKAAFSSSRDDIEARYTAGKITERRRAIYLEAIDAYWALHSVSEDEGGNPILTKYAKARAQELFDKQQSVLEPPENPRKQYKEGKWDDIEE